MSASIYRSSGGEAEILALYDGALTRLGVEYESTKIDTRFGDTHVPVTGPENAPPLVILPGGNFLNPTCLGWFLPLAKEHRVYAPDVVGQPGRSAQTRPSSKGDGHARWMEDVLESLGLERAPFVGISYGAGIILRVAARVPERITRTALVSPSGIATGSIPRMALEIIVPMVLYRLAPSHERLLRAVSPLLTEMDQDNARQIGAMYRHVRLDTRLPQLVTREELEDFSAPTLVFATEDDPFFPGDAVVARAEEVFPNLVAAKCLAGRHVPSRATFEYINAKIQEFLESP